MLSKKSRRKRPYESIQQFAMGTPWEIRLYETIAKPHRDALKKDVQNYLNAFEQKYSRFIKTSLVSKLSQSTGVFEVGRELVEMLRVYVDVYSITRGAITPLAGHMLEDIGYDAQYSLKTKRAVRSVPSLPHTVRILDDVTIELTERCLIDLGALGKGYAIKKLSERLKEYPHMINAGGDIVCRGSISMLVGLEHPKDPSKIIGTIQLADGALASSGTLRRSWGKYHHIICPDTARSPQNIIGSWVLAQDPAYADILATALFLVAPAVLQEQYPFEYLVVMHDMQAIRSSGFPSII